MIDNGLLKSEAIAKLRREGYDVSFEQLRKYEAPGLVCPYKRPSSKYRIYNSEILEKIRWICRLRLIGFSLSRIKEFFDLQKEVGGGHNRPEYDSMCLEIMEKAEKIINIMGFSKEELCGKHI